MIRHNRTLNELFRAQYAFSLAFVPASRWILHKSESLNPPIWGTWRYNYHRFVDQVNDKADEIQARIVRAEYPIATYITEIKTAIKDAIKEICP